MKRAEVRITKLRGFRFAIVRVTTGERVTSRTFATRDEAETFLSGPDRMSTKAEKR